VRTVVALLAEPVAAFELGVVAEVFGLDRSGDGLPRYDFSVCAQHPGLMQTSSGFAVHVAHGLDRLAAADLVAVPAWSQQALPPPEPVVTALRAAVERGARVLGVCSGAFLLAGAGLLDGRRAATHWRYAPALARRFPQVDVDPGVLYVADGPVVTSAGTAAAIDACLYLVREQHGAAIANAVARRMVVAAHRSGGQAQFVETPVTAAVPDDGLGELLQWVRGHLDQPLSVDDLARRALMSPRTFARRFRAATGTTPHRWLLDQRLLLAEHLLEDTDLGVEQVARRCGLGSVDTLRHHFTARRRVSPLTYRRTFRQSVSRPLATPANLR
jgi:transcriptional regulator GlxA family with amidase domain